MRPHKSHNRFTVSNASSGHGLPQHGDLDYTLQRKLPIPSTLNVRQLSESSLREAEMEPTRRQNSPSPPASSPGSSDDPQPSDDPQRVESRMETRAERLARIRREIEAVTYETPEKLEQALERMMGILVD